MAAYKKVIIYGKEYYYTAKDIGRVPTEQGGVKRVRKKFYGRTKKELEAKISEFERNMERGTEDRSIYFSIASEEYIKTFFARDSNIKPSTKATYIREWKKLIPSAPFYSWELKKVTSAQIQAYYNSMFDNGIKSSSISKVNKLMKRFYKYVSQQNIGIDASYSLSVPKETKKYNEDFETDSEEIITWTDEELKIILNNFDKAQRGFRLRFFIIIAAFCGCRFGEILGLKYSDFQEDGVHIRRQLQEEYIYNEEKVYCKPQLTSTKTDSSVRVIPLNEIVKKELQIHREWQKSDRKRNGLKETDLLFLTSSGKFYDKKNVRRALNRYYEIIGVEKKTVHAYRHTMASNCSRANIPIQITSKVMGHADISTTAKYYVNITPEQKQNAVDAIMKFVK